PPRLHPVELELLPPDDLGHVAVRRHVRPVLHPVHAVHPGPAHGGHGGGEGRHAVGQTPRGARGGRPWLTRSRNATTTRRPSVSSASTTRPRRSTTRARPCATPATSTSRRTRRSRCTGSSGRWASPTPGCLCARPSVSWRRRSPRLRGRGDWRPGSCVRGPA